MTSSSTDVGQGGPYPAAVAPAAARRRLAWFRGVRGRSTVAAVLVVAVGLCIGGATFLVLLQRELISTVQQAATAQAREVAAQVHQEGVAGARSNASSLLSRSFSPILPTSYRPLFSVYSVSFTATFAVALRERHLLRVEIEERVGGVAGDVLARLEIAALGDDRAERLHALVPHEVARLEEILLQADDDRRRLIVARVRRRRTDRCG